MTRPHESAACRCAGCAEYDATVWYPVQPSDTIHLQPPSWAYEQIAEFQRHWDSLVSGEIGPGDKRLFVPRVAYAVESPMVGFVGAFIPEVLSPDWPRPPDLGTGLHCDDAAWYRLAESIAALCERDWGQLVPDESAYLDGC